MFPSDRITGSRQQASKELKCRREVVPLWLRGLWKTLHHCPPSQGECAVWRSVSLWPAWQIFTLGAPRWLWFVSCRYTSAPTLETNRTPVITLAVGGSLQQVVMALETKVWAFSFIISTLKRVIFFYFFMAGLHSWDDKNICEDMMAHSFLWSWLEV